MLQRNWLRCAGSLAVQQRCTYSWHEHFHVIQKPSSCDLWIICDCTGSQRWAGHTFHEGVRKRMNPLLTIAGKNFSRRKKKTIAGKCVKVAWPHAVMLLWMLLGLSSLSSCFSTNQNLVSFFSKAFVIGQKTGVFGWWVSVDELVRETLHQSCSPHVCHEESCGLSYEESMPVISPSAIGFSLFWGHKDARNSRKFGMHLKKPPKFVTYKSQL